MRFSLIQKAGVFYLADFRRLALGVYLNSRNVGDVTSVRQYGQHGLGQQDSLHVVKVAVTGHNISHRHIHVSVQLDPTLYQNQKHFSELNS